MDGLLSRSRLRGPPRYEALGRLLRERFSAIETVRSTRTTIVLNTLRETCEIPLNGAGDPNPV